jgi:hypothetical protein
MLVFQAPRVFLAERPPLSPSRSSGSRIALAEDGQLADIEQQLVNAVQQVREANETSSLSSSSEIATAAASALGQSSAKTSSQSSAEEEAKVLKAALNVAVKALAEQTGKSTRSAHQPEKVHVNYPSWAKDTSKPVTLPEFKEPTSINDDTSVPSFEKLLNPVWNGVEKVNKKTTAVADQGIATAKAMNRVPDEVDKKVTKMNAHVDEAKQAYVHHAKITIDGARKAPSAALDELRQDSTAEVEGEIEREEDIDDSLNGGNEDSVAIEIPWSDKKE